MSDRPLYNEEIHELNEEIHEDLQGSQGSRYENYSDVPDTSAELVSFKKKKFPASNTIGRYSGGSVSRGRVKSSQEVAFINPMQFPADLKEEQQGLLPEMESKNAETPSDKEMFDNIRDKLLIFRTHERTIVYAVVIDKNGEYNQISALRCYGGLAFGCYPHDMNRDAYLVDCVEYAQIGTICVGEGRVKIPIPDKTAEKSFTPNQRKLIQILREKYSSDRYEIRYLQMLGAN
jgi:hypothetical protein